MRNLWVAGALCASLAGCAARNGDAAVEQAMKDIGAQEGSLSELMMTAAPPAEAIAFFKRGVEAEPNRIEMRRGLAEALTKGGQTTEAVAAWGQVLALPDATDDDRVSYAGALIRTDDWAGAKAQLAQVPPTHETFERYRLEAMVADSDQQWDKADSFYETAVGLTTTPAGVLNNWGYSKLSRGDYPGAERLFNEALRYDPTLFTAKNNLVMARGAQRRYDLPVVPMTQQERAQLLYTLALTAIKQNDVTIGRGLLKDAVDSSPTYFEEAARALEALEA